MIFTFFLYSPLALLSFELSTAIAVAYLVAWPMHIDYQRVYRLPLAMNVMCFIAFSAKVEYG